MSNLIPQPMFHSELAAFLRMVADHVEAHDSWEGNIAWEIPDGPNECDVTAVVRVGNLNGQGSVTMIGTVPY